MFESKKIQNVVDLPWEVRRKNCGVFFLRMGYNDSLKEGKDTQNKDTERESRKNKGGSGEKKKIVSFGRRTRKAVG